MAENEKLDINEFLRRHLWVKNWMNYRRQEYTKGELLQLNDLVIELFRVECSLVPVSPPVTIVGDIHGQFTDLVRLLNARISKDTARKKVTYGFACNRWLFLGDYVDRGPCSLECISLVFALKIAYPNQYILLRGNHETRAINNAYGFKEDVFQRMGAEDGEIVWEKFNEAFSYMPFAALVGSKILCMHGGIGPNLKSLDNIRKIRRPLVDVSQDPLAQDLIWADPVELSLRVVLEKAVYAPNLTRGLSVIFNEQAVIETCNALNISLIVRAHQMVLEGFRFYANRKLLTIFSAPRYNNESENDGAVLKVDESGRINIAKMRNTRPLKEKVEDEPTRGDDIPGAPVKKKKSAGTAATAEGSKSSSKSGSTKSGTLRSI
ncbi:unnamed protein product [Caenorhabditis sp. 36 PRJEB53466]|nr:unnamed protein product [Caenorhabditis sp. 36 PRJEB53466]